MAVNPVPVTAMDWLGTAVLGDTDSEGVKTLTEEAGFAELAAGPVPSAPVANKATTAMATPAANSETVLGRSNALLPRGGRRIIIANPGGPPFPSLTYWNARVLDSTGQACIQH